MDGFSNGPHMPGGPGMPGPYPQYPPSSEYPGHMQQRAPNPSTPGKFKSNIFSFTYRKDITISEQTLFSC